MAMWGDLSLLWPDVLSEAQRLRLAPLVHLGIHASPSLHAIIPPSTAEAFRQAAFAAGVHAARLERACADVMRAATAAGIRVLTLKGLPLGALVYPFAWARPMDDVDLLVAETDHPRLVELLHKLGYRNDLRGEEDFLNATRTHSIDLHTGLLNTTRVPARGALWPMTFEELWTRGQTFDLAGIPARTLGPLDTIAHLAIHAVHHHGLSGALWKADLLACFRAWPSASQDVPAACPAVRRSLWYCLEVLAAIGQDIDPKVRAALRPNRVSLWERKFLAAISRGEMPEAIRYAFTLICLPTTGRLTFLRQLLSPESSVYTRGFGDGGGSAPTRLEHWRGAFRLGRRGFRAIFFNRAAQKEPS